MSTIEQKYTNAARELALDLLNLKGMLISSSDDLRKIIACDEELIAEDANVLSKLGKNVLELLKERISTLEQYRLLNDIAKGKLTVSATDGSEVRVTFDK